MIDWFKSHPAESLGLLYAVLNFVNAIIPHGDGAFRKLFDRLMMLVPKDSPGTVKAPLLQGSKAPQ